MKQIPFAGNIHIVSQDKMEDMELFGLCGKADVRTLFVNDEMAAFRSGISALCG